MTKKPASTKRPDGILTCLDCGWHAERLTNGTMSHWCMHPRNTAEVCGTPKGAYDARKPEGFCGPNADCHTSKVTADPAAFLKH